MGYGGSVLHMIQSLRYNKSLSKRPKSFSKLREYINQQTEEKRRILDKKVSPKELAKIRRDIIHKIRVEKKRKKKKVLLSTIVLSTILLIAFLKLIFFSSFNFSATYKPKVRTTIKKQLSLKEAEEKFMYYMEDGQKWLAEEHFNNAIFQFKLARDLNPNSYEAQYGLTESYIRKCETLNKDCKKANLELGTLRQNFPNKPIPLELN
jgi:hypothetical protein